MIYYTGSKTRLTENELPLTPALTLKHNNVFGLTKLFENVYINNLRTNNIFFVKIHEQKIFVQTLGNFVHCIYHSIPIFPNIRVRTKTVLPSKS